MAYRSVSGLLGLARWRSSASALAHLPVAAAFDGAPWGVLLLDRRRVISYANPQALTLLGLSAEEVAGRPADELLGERLEPRHGRAVKDALDRTGDVEEAVWLQTLQGQCRRLRLSVAPCQTDEADGLLVHLVDDTARHQAEADRRASEASLLAFLSRSPEPAVVHAGGMVVHANQAVTEKLGYDRPEELIGQSLLKLTHPDDRQLVKERVARMLRTHEPLPVREERFLRRDGGTFHAEVFALPVMLDGRIVFLAWGRDLSEQKRADEERQQLLAERTRLMEDAQRHANELEAILDNMLTGLFVCDTSGRLTFANEVGARMLGCDSVLGLVGMTLDSLAAKFDARNLDGTPLPVQDLALHRALKGETVAVQDTRVSREGGDVDRYLRSSAGPIRNARGEIVAAVQVFRDHTDVVEFNRLKDQFMRVVAHELKTPLAIMQGYTELLARDPDAARRLDTAGAIRRGAARIERIVNDMASLSGVLERDLPLNLVPLELDEVVRHLVEAMQPTQRKHVLTLDLAPVTVLGDRVHLEQVIQRLLDNAVRYSPEGGPVAIGLKRCDDRARLTVADQGIGIPEDKQQRIFQRFYRAHTDTPHDYGGLGIGLSLSREIVNLHGGRMSFESTEGAGSAFHVELPVMPDDD